MRKRREVKLRKSLLRQLSHSVRSVTHAISVRESLLAVRSLQASSISALSATISTVQTVKRMPATRQITSAISLKPTVDKTASVYSRIKRRRKRREECSVLSLGQSGSSSLALYFSPSSLCSSVRLWYHMSSRHVFKPLVKRSAWSSQGSSWA